MRIDGPVPRHPDRTKQRVFTDRRHQPRGLLRRNDFDVEPYRSGAAHATLLLQQLLATGGKAKATDGLKDAQPAIELDAVTTEPHHGG